MAAGASAVVSRVMVATVDAGLGSLRSVGSGVALGVLLGSLRALGSGVPAGALVGSLRSVGSGGVCGRIGWRFPFSWGRRRLCPQAKQVALRSRWYRTIPTAKNPASRATRAGRDARYPRRTDLDSLKTDKLFVSFASSQRASHL